MISQTRILEQCDVYTQLKRSVRVYAHKSERLWYFENKQHMRRAISKVSRFVVALSWVKKPKVQLSKARKLMTA